MTSDASPLNMDGSVIEATAPRRRPLKILILSRNPKCYSTRRLREAALKRGHKPRVLNTLKFSIFVERGSPQLKYEEKPLARYDAVIPRIGSSITFFGTSVVRQFEQMGVFCLNKSQAISVSRDKLRAIQILSRHSVGLPATAFVRDSEAILPAIKSVGGAPVIIKLLEGTQGIGVILAETVKVAQAIVETFQSTKQNVLIQKFVKESAGKDVRALVVGNRVVAAMRRNAIGDDFRSNIHRGGTAEKMTLDAETEQMAVNAAQIIGLQVAGVDMLEATDGPQIMEVNSSPGLEGIETSTGKDVAGEIIAHLEEEVLYPELDLRHRLSIKSGYGVAEIPVSSESVFAGKTVRNSDLREQEVMILSIMRGGLILPSPSPEEQIIPGDRLVCFGKANTLRSLAVHNHGDGASPHKSG